jgi:hypothetical protein
MTEPSPACVAVRHDHWILKAFEATDAEGGVLVIRHHPAEGRDLVRLGRLGAGVVT